MICCLIVLMENGWTITLIYYKKDMHQFPSKIILFGEYAVLGGSKLLAIPFERFFGQLLIPDSINMTSQKILNSNKIISMLFNHIETNFNRKEFNSKQFSDDIKKGIYFNSNIPQAYGLGSSGALVAAIYDRYFISRQNYRNNLPNNEKQLQDNLAAIENFFHGNSSGSDPLVSYLNKHIVVNSKKPKILKKPTDLNVFLIDSEQLGKTKNQIEIFNKKKEENKKAAAKFHDLTNQVIDAYLSSDSNLLYLIGELAKIQKELIPEMFVYPKNFNKVEKSHSNKLVIKLLGSGGGGFLLAFCLSENFISIKESFKSQNIPIVPL